jgi:drug/metabolite transporter superfamily protein YnfA
MRCPKCGLENPATAEWCDCGYDFSTGKVKTSTTQPFSSSSGGTAAGYFSFQMMISPAIIRFVYVVGAIALVVYGLVVISAAAKEPGSGLGSGAYGMLLIIVGNLLWRVLCEQAILMFRMHEELTSINESLWRK